jgi:hypothetical protein
LRLGWQLTDSSHGRYSEMLLLLYSTILEPALMLLIFDLATINYIPIEAKFCEQKSEFWVMKTLAT